MAAVMAHYFHLALQLEQRTLVYSRLTPYFAKIRASRMQGARSAPLSTGAFREDLDRARWTIKALLGL